jgi:hypothetical protein
MSYWDFKTGYVRQRVCQVADISFNANCSPASYEWDEDPTKDEDTRDLHYCFGAEDKHEIEVTCDACDISDTFEYTFPILQYTCAESFQEEDVYYIFECGSSSPDSSPNINERLDKICNTGNLSWAIGDLEVSSVKPAWINVDLTGNVDEFDVSVDEASAVPGTYYIPVRMKTTSNIKSNWFTIPIKINTGNCCP